MTTKEAKKEEWEEVTSTANWWDFDKEPEIKGVYHAKKENFGANNSNVYVIKTGIKDGKDVFFSIWGKTALDGKMNDVKIGEEIKIVFNGEKTSEKTGRTYFDYSVFHRPVPLKEV